jgi:hypothetical protein
MLGGLPLSHTAIPEPKQDASYGPSPPVDQSAREEATARAQRLLYDELANVFDIIVSLSIGAQEAARRGDRVRVHGYLADVGGHVNDAREAYGRISALAALAKMGGGQ